MLIFESLLILSLAFDPHKIMLLVSDAIVLVDFSPSEAVWPIPNVPKVSCNTLFDPGQISISSNGVLIVGCTVSFAGLLFRVVIRVGLEDASGVYFGEATTSLFEVVFCFTLLEVITSGHLLQRFLMDFLAPAFLLTGNVVNAVELSFFS